MRLDQLREIYLTHRLDPHYQYRDLTDDALLEAAKKSFNRLPDKQRDTVRESWTKILAENTETLTVDAVNELLRLRFMAQTNLFFLCKILERYSQTTLATHEEICNDFFTRKDPTHVTFESFAHAYSDLKDKMILVPRGGFKSSIDIADCVQWIICYPAVTILILTGVYRLAQDFVGELREHFTFEETAAAEDKKKATYGPRQLMDKETGEWSRSMFQVLFPEHCVAPGDGSSLEFQTPAGGDEKEPSVRAASIEQALVGMHFGVLKLDDVVTNENSQTVTRLQSINRQISINRAMLHPFGFMDVIGTWYDEQDYYGVTIKQEETFAVEQGLTGNIKGSVDSGRFNSSVYVKVYLRAAWWPTAEAKKIGKIEDEMTAKDYDLWFPERLKYDFLLREKKKDPIGFAIKYLNNPRQINKVKFPRELLMRRTLPHSQIPHQGIIVTTVDTAYSTKSWADYTVIMTALIYGGRFYIINMVRGRFDEYTLPKKIAEVAYKWKPKRIAIEDSVGVKWMGRELRREMDKLSISVPVEYVSLGLGNKSKAKGMKAKPVARLIGDERMYFVNSCDGLQDIYAELEKFTGTSDDPHDDIVSALSLLADQFGAYADMEAKVSVASTQYTSDRQSQLRHDMIYGVGRFARFNAAAMDDHPVTAFQVEQAQQEMGNPSEIDPLSDLLF